MTEPRGFTRRFYVLQSVLLLGMFGGLVLATGSVLVAYAATACAVLSGALGIAYGHGASR